MSVLRAASQRLVPALSCVRSTVVLPRRLLSSHTVDYSNNAAFQAASKPGARSLDGLDSHAINSLPGYLTPRAAQLFDERLTGYLNALRYIDQTGGLDPKWRKAVDTGDIREVERVLQEESASHDLVHDAAWQKEQKRQHGSINQMRYATYLCMPILLVACIYNYDLEMKEMAHHAEHPPVKPKLPYLQRQTKPWPWQNKDCSFFDRKCNKAADAARKASA